MHDCGEVILAPLHSHGCLMSGARFYHTKSRSHLLVQLLQHIIRNIGIRIQHDLIAKDKVESLLFCDFVQIITDIFIDFNVVLFPLCPGVLLQRSYPCP